MKLSKKLSLFTYNEYIDILKDNNYKRYNNFNVLGLYRSILENKKLSIEEKIEIRDLSNNHFKKTFDFLQIKDIYVYVQLSLLGKEYTEADKDKLYDDARKFQQDFLNKKKIKHRNFGTYSKHNCGYDNCPLNGLMIKEGSAISETSMGHYFTKNRFNKIEKSIRLKKERKNKSYLKNEDYEI